MLIGVFLNTILYGVMLVQVSMHNINAFGNDASFANAYPVVDVRVLPDL